MERIHNTPDTHRELIRQPKTRIAKDCSSAIFDALHLESIPATVSESGFESLVEVDEGMQQLYDEADRIRHHYRHMTSGVATPVDPDFLACAGAISAVFQKYSPGNKVNMEARLKEFDQDNRVKASEMIKQGLGVCADKSACAQYFQDNGFNAKVMVTDMRSPSTGSREKHACVLVSVDGKDFIVDPNNPLLVGNNQVLPAIFEVNNDIAYKIRSAQGYDTGKLVNVLCAKHSFRYAA